MLRARSTCFCSLDRNSRAESLVALRWTPRPCRVRRPLLEQDHAWLRRPLLIPPSPSVLSAHGWRWTPSCCSGAAVTHCPVWPFTRAALPVSQRHSCSGLVGLQCAVDTRPWARPPWACRHFPSSLFRIMKLEASIIGEYTRLNHVANTNSKRCDETPVGFEPLTSALSVLYPFPEPGGSYIFLKLYTNITFCLLYCTIQCTYYYLLLIMDHYAFWLIDWLIARVQNMHRLNIDQVNWVGLVSLKGSTALGTLHTYNSHTVTLFGKSPSKTLVVG